MVKRYLISNADQILKLDALQEKLDEQLALNRSRGCYAHANYEDCSTMQLRRDIANVWAVIAANCPSYDYPNDPT